jgi:hypothetical protein
MITSIVPSAHLGDNPPQFGTIMITTRSVNGNISIIWSGKFMMHSYL